MTRQELQAELEKARMEKVAMNAIVDPLRAERDALIAQMQPLESRAAGLADKINGYMPRMAEIDRRMSALARQLGHPRVGGLPEPFGR